MLTLTVGAERAGERLDALLQGLEVPALGPLSQRRARALCELHAVAIDGVVAAGSTRLRQGQRVTFAAGHAARTLQLRIPVEYEADDVLVLWKPPGLAVHKGPLVDHSVADALAKACPGAGLAQRIDRDASGLLLVGLTTSSLQRLGAAMEHGGIDRHYLAVVAGVVAKDQQTIDLPLRVTDEPRGDQPKTIIDPTGQRAVSHVTVVDRRKDASLVRVQLDTGRTHQIRAHLRAIGHPLLGDARYGDPQANARARSTFGVDRTLLHGTRLSFPAVIAGDTVEVVAAHPTDFARLFPRLAARA